MRNKLRSSILISLFILSLFGGLNFLKVRASPTYTWTTPERVTIYSGYDSAPSIAEDAQGRVWLVWERQVSIFPSNFQTYLKIWNGTSWSNGVNATSKPYQDMHPSIARLQNGNMMIAWSSNRTGNYGIWYRNFDGVTWGPETQLTTNKQPNSGVGLLVTRDGRIWAAWHRMIASGVYAIFLRVFDGVAWGPEQQITNSSMVDSLPHLRQMTDGRVWLVWNRSASGNAQNWYKIYDGTNWSAETQFTPNDGLVDFNPDVVQSKDGAIWFFWSKDLPVRGSLTDFEEHLFYMNSFDNGLSWSSQVQLTFSVNSTMPNDDSFPSLVQSSADGRLWLAFGSTRDTCTCNWEIWLMKTNQLVVHDVNVAGIGGNRTVVYPGETVQVTVAVTNPGNFTENPTVFLTVNSSLTGGTSVSIPSRGSAVVFFNWNTAGKSFGRYYVRANATVTGETVPNLLDNGLTLTVKVMPRADVDRDGSVDIVDAAIVAAAFDSTPGMPNWNPAADINMDGKVNILDMASVAFYFGFKP
jgi:hypothetical protein